MKYSKQIKSISYLKANTADIAQRLREDHGAYVITQNGEASMVIQDVQTYEETQETLALLKMLALGNQQVDAGKTVSVQDAFQQARKSITISKP